MRRSASTLTSRPRMSRMLKRILDSCESVIENWTDFVAGLGWIGERNDSVDNSPDTLFFRGQNEKLTGAEVFPALSLAVNITYPDILLSITQSLKPITFPLSCIHD